MKPKKTSDPRAKMKQAVAKFLNDLFLDYERRVTGQRATINDFAEWLKVEPGALNHWMHGIRLPTGTNIDKIAQQGGQTFYTVMGLLPRDRRLTEIVSAWGTLSDDDQAELLEDVKQRRVNRKTALTPIRQS